MGPMGEFLFDTGWEMSMHGASLEEGVRAGLIGTAVGRAVEVGPSAVGRGVRMSAGAAADGIRWARNGGFGQIANSMGRRVRDAGDSIRRAWRGTDADVPGGRSLRNADTSPHLGQCSFTPDTVVATEDGDVPISELEVGDEVLAYNEETGEVGTYTVTAVHVHTDDEILYLIVDGELIVTTPDHPFYTDEGEWVAVGELVVGDVVVTVDGSGGVVEALEVVIAPQPMYNLTVDEAHTYFVGDGEWLVHNRCDGVITVPAGQGNRTLSLSDGTAITEGQVVSQSEAVRIQNEWVGEDAWSDDQFLHSAEAEPTTGQHHRARWDIDDNPPHLNLEAGTWVNEPGRTSPIFRLAEQNGRPENFHLYYTP